MSATAPAQQHLADCPACKKPITADVTYELELAHGRVGGAATATLTLTGVRVQHDCMPRTTRRTLSAFAASADDVIG